MNVKMSLERWLRLVNKQWLTRVRQRARENRQMLTKLSPARPFLSPPIAAHLFHKLSPSPFQLLLLIKTFGTFFPFTFPRSTLQCLKLSCREQELKRFCPLNLVMNSPDDTLLKRHNTSSYLSPRSPTSQWLGELPSLCEAECSVMLQSKSLGPTQSRLPGFNILQSRANGNGRPNILQEVRRIQNHARIVSRAFADLCR